MLLKKLNNMPNVQTKVEINNNSSDNVDDVPKEITESQISFALNILELVWIVRWEPGVLIEKLKNYRAVNDD